MNQFAIDDIKQISAYNSQKKTFLVITNNTPHSIEIGVSSFREIFKDIHPLEFRKKFLPNMNDKESQAILDPVFGRFRTLFQLKKEGIIYSTENRLDFVDAENDKILVKKIYENEKFDFCFIDDDLDPQRMINPVFYASKCKIERVDDGVFLFYDNQKIYNSPLKNLGSYKDSDLVNLIEAIYYDGDLKNSISPIIERYNGIKIHDLSKPFIPSDFLSSILSADLNKLESIKENILNNQKKDTDWFYFIKLDLVSRAIVEKTNIEPTIESFSFDSETIDSLPAKEHFNILENMACSENKIVDINEGRPESRYVYKILDGEQMFNNKVAFDEVYENSEYFERQKDGLKAVVVKMPPRDYCLAVEERQVEHKENGASKEKLSHLKEVYESGIKVDIPMLAYGSRESKSKDTDLFQQEGYHRAVNALLSGKEFIPVAIRYREGDSNIPDYIKEHIENNKLDIIENNAYRKEATNTNTKAIKNNPSLSL